MIDALAKTRSERTKGHEGLVVEDRAKYEFRVSRRAFVDHDILAAERREIFDRCWLYVGHESEFSQPNDFITRTVGGRDLIIARDRKGEVHAFFNTCPHRGATVEREKCGNKLAFQCFYHGWAFNNNGRFSTRYRAKDYPETFNEDGCKNLAKVARFDQYRGLYFLNFDAGAGSLKSYLGDAREYIDLVMDHAGAGMEITGGAQEYSIRANWKLLVENSVDGYHAMATHSTYFDYLFHELGVTQKDIIDQPEPRYRSRAVDLGNGHAVITGGPCGVGSWGRPVAHWIPAWGDLGKVEVERRKSELTDLFGPERAALIASWNRNMLIFPNLVINDIMAVTVRTFFPLAPDLMTVNAWALAPRDESVEFRTLRFENFLEFLGPGGFATPDDQEALEACQRGYRNAVETGWNDISRGMMRERPRDNDEEQMRCFWREWASRIDRPGKPAHG